MLGDFNLNLFNAEDDLNCSKFLDILGSNLILPQISLPTRITGDSKTLIENIFSSVTTADISGNIFYSISDHLPKFCIFDTKPGVVGENGHFKQNWSKFYQDKFIRNYNEIDWDYVFDECDMDLNLPFNSFDLIMNGFGESMDHHIPTVGLTKRQSRTRLTLKF